MGELAIEARVAAYKHLLCDLLDHGDWLIRLGLLRVIVSLVLLNLSTQILNLVHILLAQHSPVGWNLRQCSHVLGVCWK